MYPTHKSCTTTLAAIGPINQSINQNLYSAPSRSLLRGAPDPGGGIENRHRLGRAIDLRKSTLCCWTNHRKRTGLHCRRTAQLPPSLQMIITTHHQQKHTHRPDSSLPPTPSYRLDNCWPVVYCISLQGVAANRIHRDVNAYFSFNYKNILELLL